MRRVLFLAYHFPPVGGSGVQRSLAFARYLRESGYDPVVVTGPGLMAGRWTPADPSLSDGVPADLEVLRLESEPEPASRRRRRAQRLLGLESSFARWWVEGAVVVGRRASGIDLVYASMSPFETASAAATLSRALGRPWVADLRDPWALDELTVYPSALHRRRELRRMRRLLGTASAIVMNTEEAAQAVRERFPALAGRVATIPNGFDARNFEGHQPERRDGTFRVVHAGYLHTELGRSFRRFRTLRRLAGGAPERVDLLTRSHLYLLDAVERVLAAEPDLRARIEVHLAGVLSEADRELLRPDVVHAHGYLPHAEAVALVRSADLLFLPMHDLPPGRRARIVPAKTYEYLASGRPILAAVPDGDACELLSRAETALLCRPSDVAAMARIIAAEARTFLERGRARTRRPGVVLPYERRELTRRLAAVFDTVVSVRATAEAPPLLPAADPGEARLETRAAAGAARTPSRAPRPSPRARAR